MRVNYLGLIMKIKELIVVEGKTDLIFLKSFLDADIVITNGSEVSHETLEFIKEANKRQGVIILTDPDYPGLRIRNIVSEYIGECKHAYIEKKKAIKGKKVGIAETSKKDIIDALNNVVTYSKKNGKVVKEVDLYELGLFGNNDSKAKRNKVCEYYHLGWCNAKTFLNRINMFNITIDMIKEVIKNDYSI